MRWLFVFLFMLLLPAVARGASVAALTAPDSAGGWVTLAVGGLPAGTSRVALQDGRGGPVVEREVSGMPGAVLMALPLVAPAELSGGRWVIRVAARDAAGKELERGEVRVALPLAGVYRVAVAEGSQGMAAGVAWPTTLPREWAGVPPEELAGAPAQALAGFDGVFISAAAARKMDQGRVMALLGAGLTVVVEGEAGAGEPFAGLSRLAWVRVEGATAAWRCVSEEVAPLRPVVPEVGQLRVESGNAGVPRSVVQGLLLLGPAAVFLAIVVRGMLRRRAVIAAATGVVMAGLGAGMIVYLRAAEAPAEPIAAWRAVRGAANAPTAGVEMETEIALHRTLFGQEVELEAGMVMPLAATARGWWRMTNVVVGLRGEGMGLKAALRGREALLVQRVRAAGAMVIPPFPESAAARARFLETLHAESAAGGWVVGGYVYPADAAELEGNGTIFAAWARGREAERGSLEAWYGLRFEGAKKYFIWIDNGALRVVEFGGSNH